MVMSGYEVIYVKDIVENCIRIYIVNYKWWGVDGKVREEFDLMFDILYDKNFIKVEVYNLFIKYYFGRDIFISICVLL